MGKAAAHLPIRQPKQMPHRVEQGVRRGVVRFGGGPERGSWLVEKLVLKPLRHVGDRGFLLRGEVGATRVERFELGLTDQVGVVAELP